MQKNIFMLALGCPKARVDAEVMYGLLAREGWVLVPEAEDADAILINTCAFLQSSIDESIDAILEYAEQKNGRCKRLVVAGCLPSRYAQEMAALGEALPEVDAFVTTNDIKDILQAIELPPPPPRMDLDYHLARTLAGTQAYAYLKISEGCDRQCSFCTIPQIRGKQVSRPIESLVLEAKDLVAKGVREIVLVAQELTHYGADIGLKDGLLQLIDAIEPIEGLVWIRLLYTYPWNFGENLIQRLGKGKVLPYTDIPLQHVSQRILKDMRRRSSQQEQDALLRRLREVPGMILRSTMIVGYPGETEEEFEELVQWIKDIRFDRLGVFVYSAEPNTTAGEREDQIPQDVKEERYDRIMLAQQSIHAEKMTAMIGKRLTVLVDGPSEEHPLVLEGRYAGQAPEVDGKIFLSYEESDQDPAEIGDFVDVEIIDATEYDLLGKVLDKA